VVGGFQRVASVAIALLPAALPNEANTVTRLLAAAKQRRQWLRSSVFEATAKTAPVMTNGREQKNTTTMIIKNQDGP
jgi:hypothetical protein